LWTICQGWLRTAILLIAASWLTRIIGASHQCLQKEKKDTHTHTHTHKKKRKTHTHTHTHTHTPHTHTKSSKVEY
jgi:hypothetical protein